MRKLLATACIGLLLASCAGKASQYNPDRQDRTTFDVDPKRNNQRPPKGSCPDCDDGGPKPPPSYNVVR
jgi:hypothetical protein